MNKYLLILTALLLSSCGREEAKEFRVDPVLMPYYQNFVSQASLRSKKVSTDNLILEFGETEGQVIGFCQTGTTTTQKGFKTVEKRTPRVVINPQYFTQGNEYNRRDLINHELGHCLMKLAHDTRTNSAGRPESLMYPYAVAMVVGCSGTDYTWGCGFYANNESNYLDQLFGLKSLALSDNTKTGSYASLAPEIKVKARDGEEQVNTFVSTLAGCEGHEEIHAHHEHEE